MQAVEQGDEELVRILLGVASQVARMLEAVRKRRVSCTSNEETGKRAARHQHQASEQRATNIRLLTSQTECSSRNGAKGCGSSEYISLQVATVSAAARTGTGRAYLSLAVA